ncbi:MULTISPECIES: hypothetical protein [unclassified Bradyrhizobium]|uniref:hypothetical protein n=1 Tax=unclassified Bradyrhizobium TaxID=2631580 RepID=UPI0029170D16|nr:MULTISPECIES: hypothetical protein [unclassified Bradyrhizobium]
MAIPTAKDFELRAIDEIMANVATRLVTLRHTPGRKDVPGLRVVLQTLVDKVMAYAHDCEQ